MLKAKGRTVGFYPAAPIPSEIPFKKNQQGDEDHRITTLRFLTFMRNPAHGLRHEPAHTVELMPIAPAIEKDLLRLEVASLPKHQCLVAAGSIEVYFSTWQQTPTVVTEIRRLRELVFRDLDEGSGRPQDGDEFDHSYLHLFLFDCARHQIIGACRLGRTDELLKNTGTNGLYLSQMFDFKPGFINRTRPCLEMGRSFIIPDFQRSYYALQLLFKGIGAFVGQFPQYQTLYGTVSISQQYSVTSALLIREALLNKSSLVAAHRELPSAVPAEMSEYLQRCTPNLLQLDWLVRQLEADGKGLPVLLRHYAKMHATFYAMGIDPNFAGTPGLLLSVDLAALSLRTRQRFLS